MTQIPSRVEPAEHLLRGVIIVALFLSIQPSCKTATIIDIPGVSDQPFGIHERGNSRENSDGSANTTWEYADRTSELDLLATYPSRGHGTLRWNAELRANATARRSMALPESGPESELDSAEANTDVDLAVGSMLVQRHAKQPGGTDAGFFVMTKREKGYFPSGGDWEYMVVDETGKVQARGKLERCARCHAEAQRGFVFWRN